MLQTFNVRISIFIISAIFSVTLNAQEVKEFFAPEIPITHLYDTTFNELKISWKYETISDQHIVQEFEDDGTLYRVKYRDFQLRVITPNHNQVFDKMYFQDSIGFDPDLFSLKFLRLEGFDEQTKELQFFLTIIKPDTDWTYPIYLYVKLDGNSRFELPTFKSDY